MAEARRRFQQAMNEAGSWLQRLASANPDYRKVLDDTSAWEDEDGVALLQRMVEESDFARAVAAAMRASQLATRPPLTQDPALAQEAETLLRNLEAAAIFSVVGSLLVREEDVDTTSITSMIEFVEELPELADRLSSNVVPMFADRPAPRFFVSYFETADLLYRLDETFLPRARSTLLEFTKVSPLHPLYRENILPFALELLPVLKDGGSRQDRRFVSFVADSVPVRSNRYERYLEEQRRRTETLGAAPVEPDALAIELAVFRIHSGLLLDQLDRPEAARAKWEQGFGMFCDLSDQADIVAFLKRDFALDKPVSEFPIEHYEAFCLLTESYLRQSLASGEKMFNALLDHVEAFNGDLPHEAFFSLTGLAGACRGFGRTDLAKNVVSVLKKKPQNDSLSATLKALEKAMLESEGRNIEASLLSWAELQDSAGFLALHQQLLARANLPEVAAKIAAFRRFVQEGASSYAPLNKDAKAKALELAEAYYSACKKHLGRRHFITRLARRHLLSLSSALGTTAAVIDLLQREIEQLQQEDSLDAGDMDQLAEWYDALGNAYRDLAATTNNTKNLELARDAFEQAAEWSAKSHHSRHGDNAADTVSTALVSHFDASLEVLECALEIATSATDTAGRETILKETLNKATTLLAEFAKLNEAFAQRQSGDRSGDDGYFPGRESFALLVRARCRWQLIGQDTIGDEQSGIATDLERALELARQYRRTMSVDYRDDLTADPWDAACRMLIELRAEQDNAVEMFRAMEMLRSRTMLEMVNAQRIDWRNRASDEQKARLRAAENALRDANLRLGASESFAAYLEARRRAENELAAVENEIKNGLPAYRRAVLREVAPGELHALRELLAKQSTTGLAYYVGEERSYMMSIPAAKEQPVTIHELVITPSQAAVFGLTQNEKEGPQGNLPLTRKRLNAILTFQRGGVSSRLLGLDVAPSTRGPVPVSKLFCLWETLIPEALRQQIESTRNVRLCIFPDPALERFPFGALVTNHLAPGKERYLLSKVESIQYAPSATILLTLLNRGQDEAEGTESSGEDKGVTVVVRLVRQESEAPVGRLAATSRGRSARRHVRPSHRDLPTLGEAADQESDRMLQGMQSRLKMTQLRESKATEQEVRAAITGSRLIHFAGHGACDAYSYANQFATLYLTPGDPRRPGADGYLELREVYQLDLDGCELAVLNACFTNTAPSLDPGSELDSARRTSEPWTLARGFLVAGCRRVMCTQWEVSNRAAPKLILPLCERLVGKSTDKVDWTMAAAALHAAKRELIADPEFEDPYYWAPFVLVGP